MLVHKNYRIVEKSVGGWSLQTLPWTRWASTWRSTWVRWVGRRPTGIWTENKTKTVFHWGIHPWLERISQVSIVFLTALNIFRSSYAAVFSSSENQAFFLYQWTFSTTYFKHKTKTKKTKTNSTTEKVVSLKWTIIKYGEWKTNTNFSGLSFLVSPTDASLFVLFMTKRELKHMFSTTAASENWFVWI